MTPQELLTNFETLVEAPNGIQYLRELVLKLAMRGKLVEQNPSEGQATSILKKIGQEQLRWNREEGWKPVKRIEPIQIDDLPYTVPNGWVWARLPSLVSYRVGKTPSTKEPRYWGGQGTPWVSIGDMPVGGVVSITSKCVSPAAEREVFTYPPAPAGTLLMSFKLTIGKVAVLGIPAFHNEAIISIKTKDDETRDYLKYMLPILAKFGGSKQAIMGATLNGESLARLLIPVPPLAEQRRIVARLDELMTLLDRLEAKRQERETARTAARDSALAALREAPTPDDAEIAWLRIQEYFHELFATSEDVEPVRKLILELAVRGKLVGRDPADEPAVDLMKRVAYFRQLEITAEGRRPGKPSAYKVGDKVPIEIPPAWTWARLDELTTKLGSGKTPLGGRSVYITQGIKFIRSQNVWNDGLRLSDVAYIDTKTYASMSATSVRAMDLLFNITGASIGRCAIVPDDFDEGNVSQHVCIVRLAEPDLRGFVHLALISNLLQTEVMNVQVGISREGLSTGRFKEFLIPIPPLPEQKRIVARVNHLQALLDQLSNSLRAQADLSDVFVSAAVHHLHA